MKRNKFVGSKKSHQNKVENFSKIYKMGDFFNSFQ